MSKSEETTEKEETLSKELESTADWLKTVLGVITGSVSVFYTLGYIIVNLRLGSLGIHDYSLGNPAYLPAGILFSLVNALGIVAPVFLGSMIWRDARLNVSQISTVASVLSLFGVGVVLAILYIIGDFRWVSPFTGILREDSEDGQWIGYALIIPSIVLLTSVTLGTRFRNIQERGIFFYVLIIQLVVLFPIVISIWGRSIYPHIKASYGGGQTVTVQFVIADYNKADLFTQIGINFDSPNKTETLELVDDNGSTFIVLLANGQAVKIDKALVANMLYWTPRQLYDSSQGAQTPSIIMPTVTPVLGVTSTP